MTTPEATTTSTTPVPPSTPESVGSVDLVCGSGDGSYGIQTVTLAANGTPDYSTLWKSRMRCDSGFDDMGVYTTVPPITPLQEAVVAAATKAGYTEEKSEMEALYSVYEICGSNDPDDAYMTMEDYSEGQVAELKAVMTLCPKHPQAATWRKGIAASVKAAAAEKNGERVYDGTYNVPAQMKRGTWVVKDVKDCYWETRDSSGEILVNNFINAAPRVVAKVSKRAVVFTAEGCGQWDLQ